MPEVMSLAELMGREDSTSTSSMRCSWQGTESVETEDWWGLESPTTSPERCSPNDGFEILEKSSSGKPLFHEAGHRTTLFSCFGQSSSMNLTEPDLGPRTPPASSSTRRGANVTSTFTFTEEAMEHHHQYQTDYHDEFDLHPDGEPTSPAVNCIGQVRPKKKQKQRCKKTDPAPRDSDKLPGTKSQAPAMRASAAEVPRSVAKSKSGKWKQLLQRSGSTISPSNHSQSDSAELEVGVAVAIDLGRFGSAR